MSTEIELMPDPVRSGITTDGPVRCEQSAILTIDHEVMEQIWTPSTLELLARSYWEYLTGRTRGAIKMAYGPENRTVVLVSRRIPLLRFSAPRFTTGPGAAAVEWPIEEGLLVAKSGRRQGHLRIEASRQDPPGDGKGRQRLLVTAEVANFYPWMRASGRFARLGTWIYSQTQLRVHIWITRGFLRSLTELPNEILKAREKPSG